MNLARRSMANLIEDVKSEYANTALIIFEERNGKSEKRSFPKTAETTRCAEIIVALETSVNQIIGTCFTRGWRSIYREDADLYTR